MSIAITFSKTAAQCPAVQYATTMRSLQQAFDSPNGTAPAGPNYEGGMTDLLVDGLNQMSLAANLAAMCGSSIRGVFNGLVLSADANPLEIDISAGQAVGDGIIEVTTAKTQIAVVNNGTSYIWLVQTTPVQVMVVNNSTTPPAVGNDGLGNPIACVYLGQITSASGAITAIDCSGVVNVKGGLAYRVTADAGAPGDTPGAGCPTFRSYSSVSSTQFYDWNPVAGAWVMLQGPTSLPVEITAGTSGGVPTGTPVTGTEIVLPAGWSVAAGGGGKVVLTSPAAETITIAVPNGMQITPSGGEPGSSATGTSFALTFDLAAGMVKSDGAGNLEQATAETDYEEPLGNPGTSGQVLASTNAGVRSWVAQPTITSLGAEPALGDPSANGQVLASSTAGVRSWVTLPPTPTQISFNSQTLTFPATDIEYLVVVDFNAIGTFAYPNFIPVVTTGMSGVCITMDTNQWNTGQFAFRVFCASMVAGGSGGFAGSTFYDGPVLEEITGVETIGGGAVTVTLSASVFGWGWTAPTETAAIAATWSGPFAVS